MRLAPGALALLCILLLPPPALGAERMEIFRLHLDEALPGEAGQMGTIRIGRAFADVSIALDCLGVDAAFQIGFPAWLDARESAAACAEGAPSVVVHTTLPVGDHAVNGAISWSAGSWSRYMQNGFGPRPDTGLTLVVSGVPG